jgi:hypothetical protein
LLGGGQFWHDILHGLKIAAHLMLFCFAALGGKEFPEAIAAEDTEAQIYAYFQKK